MKKWWKQHRKAEYFKTLRFCKWRDL